MRLRAQLHQLLQSRARKDVRAAVDGAGPGQAPKAGLGDRPPAAGGCGTANDLQLPARDLSLSAGARDHGDGQQPFQRLALRRRLARALNLTIPSTADRARSAVPNVAPRPVCLAPALREGKAVMDPR